MSARGNPRGRLARDPCIPAWALLTGGFRQSNDLKYLPLISTTYLQHGHDGGRRLLRPSAVSEAFTNQAQ